MCCIQQSTLLECARNVWLGTKRDRISLLMRAPQLALSSQTSAPGDRLYLERSRSDVRLSYTLVREVLLEFYRSRNCRTDRKYPRPPAQPLRGGIAKRGCNVPGILPSHHRLRNRYSTELLATWLYSCWMHNSDILNQTGGACGLIRDPVFRLLLEKPNLDY